jgi:hypothetical protein
MHSMRKLIVVATMATTLAVPSTAFANAAAPSQTAAPTGGIETGWIGTTQGGKHMQTTQYRATYQDPTFGGLVTCSGVNQVGTSDEQDSFTCRAGAGGSFTIAPTVGEKVYWWSDFHLVRDGTVREETMTVQSVRFDANGNAIAYTGLAQ